MAPRHSGQQRPYIHMHLFAVMLTFSLPVFVRAPCLWMPPPSPPRSIMPETGGVMLTPLPGDRDAKPGERVNGRGPPLALLLDGHDCGIDYGCGCCFSLNC